VGKAFTAQIFVGKLFTAILFGISKEESHTGIARSKCEFPVVVYAQLQWLAELQRGTLAIRRVNSLTNGRGTKHSGI
jgi:hypothetical protein